MIKEYKKILTCLICLCLFTNFIFGQQLRKYRLVIRTTGEITMHDGKTIPMYGISSSKLTPPTFPNPTIVAYVGDTLEVEVANISQQPQSIHFHGLDSDAANDGNPVTSFSIYHRQLYTYRFILKHSGTYTYYGNVSEIPYNALGIYGLVKVLPSPNSSNSLINQPTYECDTSIITSEIDTIWNNYFAEYVSYNPFIGIVSEFMPTYFLANGQSSNSINLTFYLHQNYLRLVNCGLLETEYVFPSNLSVYIDEIDGRKLDYNPTIKTLKVAPGERYGLIIVVKNYKPSEIQIIYRCLENKQIAHRKTIQISIVDSFNSQLNESKYTTIPYSKNYNPSFDSANKNISITYLNILGSIVFQQYSKSDNLSILGTNFYDLQPGFYYTKLSVKEKTFYQKHPLF